MNILNLKRRVGRKDSNDGRIEPREFGDRSRRQGRVNEDVFERRWKEVLDGSVVRRRKMNNVLVVD